MSPSENPGGPAPTEPSDNKNTAHKDSPLLTAALAHARAGRAVFPLHTPTFPAAGGPANCSCGDAECDSVGKHPRTKNGLKDATTDETIIRGWWTDWPDANIGMVVGTWCVVLDVDPRHGGDQTLSDLEAKHGKLPRTPEALTGGGGRHICLAHPGGHVKSRSIAPGLDCKGNGGYIVVEPSLHASGNRYAWELSSLPDEVPLAPVPPWLLKLMLEPLKKPTTSSKESEPDGAIKEGQRNNTLISLAGSMRNRGMTPEAILAALRAENKARCKPPLDDAEVVKIVASAARYDPSEPPPWDTPLPLFVERAAPPFPIDDAFPPALRELRDFVVALAHELQVPQDLIAMLVIAIAAIAIVKKFEIEARPGWREIAAMWVLVLLVSGERKSVAFKRVTDPLIEWEREQSEKLAPDLAAAQEERAILEAKRSEARKRAGKGDAAARERAKELARELAGMKEVAPPALMTTDATSEALVSLLVSNGERALVASPEGDALDVLLGRYDEKARPNMGVWLKGYSGDRVRVHRRGRPPEFLEKPALCVAMTVQPEAVRGMFSSRVARGRGLLARFFASLPTSKVGHRLIGAPPVAEALEMKYVTSLRRLLDIDLDLKLGPRIVRLDADAQAMFFEFESRVERELGDGGCLGERRDWGAKLCGGILRIALILHCLECFAGSSARSAGSAHEVNIDTMRAALSWAPYLIEHERLATSVVGCDWDTAVASRVLRWLVQNGQESFSRRDCFSACRGREVQRVEDIDAPLALLTDLGYVRRQQDPASNPHGGRRPSPVYEVNPKWDRGGAQ